MQESNQSILLLNLLQESNLFFISFSKLKNTPKRYQKIFGFHRGSTNIEIEQKIQPHLGNDLEILKGNRSKYLALKLQHNKIVSDYIGKHPGLTPKQVVKNLPMLKDEFIKELNVLLKSGEILIIYDKKYLTKLYLNKKVPFKTESEKNNDFETFRKEFQNLDRGRIFVRICDLRKRLMWSTDKFNSVIEELRDHGVIQLHSGDVSAMDDSQVNDSYIDENHFLHITVTMRKNE